MYILEDYLSDAKKKLDELEDQFETWTKKKDTEFGLRSLNRPKNYHDAGLADFNKDREKEKARFLQRIESVKSEITYLEKQIGSEDYQLLKYVHAGLDSTMQRARLEWG